MLTMKKLTYFLFACFFLCACYKVEQVPKDNSIPTYAFSLNSGNPEDSVMTLSVLDSQDFSFNMSFRRISGNPENLSIHVSLDSLPVGITAETNAFAFKLNSDVQINLHVAIPKRGDDTIRLKVFDSSNGLRVYRVHIHILPPLDGATALRGTYTGLDGCNFLSGMSIDYNYTAVIDTVAGHPHWISIKNFRGLGDSVVVMAFVTCYNQYSNYSGNIDIPVQTVAGYTIGSTVTGYYGTGGTEKEMIDITSYTMSYAGGSLSCSAQLNQK
jgi:hypothetical protein